MRSLHLVATQLRSEVTREIAVASTRTERDRTMVELLRDERGILVELMRFTRTAALALVAEIRYACGDPVGDPE